MTDRELLELAAKNADWRQVVANGGPPCFFIEGTHFCLRAQAWEGHDVMHEFVPLHELFAAAIGETK